MPTHQDGQIIERSGAFYVRYYTNTAEGRKRVAHWLCVKDAKHRSETAASVKQLADEHMIKVNAEAGARPRTNRREFTVAEFWDETYLPWAVENLRPSSVHGYTKIWKQHLDPHFKKRALRDYRTHEGSLFITGLAKTLSRNSLQHVRSLASGIFTHALNLGLLESNPWHDVKVLAKTRAAAPTKHYTLEEAEDIVSALVDRVDGQAVFAFAFFLGLRPSEIAGLKWSDVDDQFIHIRRATVQGIVGGTKTPKSQASLPLIQPVKGLLQLWRKKSGNPTDGWIFPNAKGGPLNVVSFVRIVILPAVKKAKLEWKGLYAARRGCATAIAELTNGNLASQGVLRQTSSVTTDRHYINALNAGHEGLKLLEKAATAAQDDQK